MKEIARTNQNPNSVRRRFALPHTIWHSYKWRWRKAPPSFIWVLCPKQNFHCYKKQNRFDNI